MRSLLMSLVVALALPLALLPTGIATAQVGSEAEPDGVGIRLIDVPVATQDDPRARQYIIDNIPPGTTIERRVEVTNRSDSSQSVFVYAGSARIVDGEFAGDGGSAQSELTGWTSFSDSPVELKSGASAEVTVTVDVPLDASEGEAYAAIWAEIRAPQEESSGIINASRAGIRMYVSVGPGNGAAADFNVGAIEASRTDANLPQLTAVVTNTGGRAVDVNGSLALSDGPSALSAGPFATENALTLAPGEQGEIVVTLGSDLPDGPWQATLTLTSGLISHDATAEVTFPEAGEAVAVEKDTGIGLWPILIGAGGVVLLVAAGVGLWLRRRRLNT